MVVSRSNYKPMSNKINGDFAEKHNSLSDPITVICSSSDDDGNISSNNTCGKPTVITISDDDINTNDEEMLNNDNNMPSRVKSSNSNVFDYFSERPKRNIERTNYNQSKMIKKLYKQNSPKKDSISNLVRVKRQSKDHLRLSKSAEKLWKRKAKLEAMEPIPPSNAIHIDNLLSCLSPSKKIPVVCRSSFGKRTKTVQHEDSSDLKFAKISNRAFRYPWEWQASQKSVNVTQILGFRTLSDGLCETLMCRK